MGFVEQLLLCLSAGWPADLEREVAPAASISAIYADLVDGPESALGQVLDGHHEGQVQVTVRPYTHDTVDGGSGHRWWEKLPLRQACSGQ